MNFAYEGILMPAHFKFFTAAKSPTPAAAFSQVRPNLFQAKDARTIILEALHLCGGNKKAAAQQLGMARSTLYEKMKKYHIDGTAAPFD